MDTPFLSNVSRDLDKDDAKTRASSYFPLFLTGLTFLVCECILVSLFFADAATDSATAATPASYWLSGLLATAMCCHVLSTIALGAEMYLVLRWISNNQHEEGMNRMNYSCANGLRELAIYLGTTGIFLFVTSVLFFARVMVEDAVHHQIWLFVMLVCLIVSMLFVLILRIVYM